VWESSWGMWIYFYNTSILVIVAKAVIEKIRNDEPH